MARQRHEDPAPEAPITAPTPTGEDRRVEASLRPLTFDDYVGQEDLKRPLRTMVQAAHQLDTALDHLLFYGPPGLGKTTLAHIVAHEMGVSVHQTSGPAVEHKGVLAGLLTNLADHDVLFIDEIHRLPPTVEEALYPAMEDFTLDVLIGDGPHAKAITMPLPRFTLVGATTRTGLLTSPLQDRFGFTWRLTYYTDEELTRIITRSAERLGMQITADGAIELGSRARGTPRVANRWLRRARDYAEVDGSRVVDRRIADMTLACRWTPPGSTPWTAPTCAASSSDSTAAPWASRPWPPPSPRIARPSSPPWSPTWSSTASWTAPPAAASPPCAPPSTSA
jgi:Holliday junction DNA helicase RuvB